MFLSNHCAQLMINERQVRIHKKTGSKTVHGYASKSNIFSRKVTKYGHMHFF